MKSLKRKAGRATCLFALGALWGCDIPTDTPKLDQEWILPIVETSIGVAEFLPEDVGLAEDSSAFTVLVDPFIFKEDLGTLCGAGCAGLDGLTVPKPAFQEDFHEGVDLPDDVESAEIQDGLIEVVARNRFSFDPLRPPGGNPGSFTLALHDGGPTGPILDEVVIDGTDTSFGPDATLSRDLEYSGSVGSTLTVTVSVNSPAGGAEPGNWVLVDLEDEIEVTATPEVIEATSAVVSVAGETFDLGVSDLDVGGVGEDFVNRIQSGVFRLGIVNPWSVGAILNLTISGPTMEAPVVLIAQIPASPTASVTVEFSQAEIQSFLGQPNVVMVGQGTVDQTSGDVTLAPGQTMTIDTRLDLVIQIG